MDVDKERQELEEIELNTIDSEVPEEVYIKLMLCYLLQNDICSAKFLWRRAPACLKTDRDEPAVLSRLWHVAQCMSTRRWPLVHDTLQQTTWPSSLQPRILQLQESARAGVMFLLATAYSSISVSRAGSMLGFSDDDVDQCVNMLKEKGWQIDGDMASPSSSSSCCGHLPSSTTSGSARDCGENREDMLEVLTEYVSFLET